MAKELREETYSSSYAARDPAAAARRRERGRGCVGGMSGMGRLTDSCILDVDLARIELSASAADEASRAIDDIKSGMTEQRIARLERSMIRNERTSAATLTLLQQLVNAVRVRGPQGESESGTRICKRGRTISARCSARGRRAPNFMKMAPILRAFAAHQPPIPTLLVHTYAENVQALPQHHHE